MRSLWVIRTAYLWHWELWHHHWLRGWGRGHHHRGRAWGLSTGVISSICPSLWYRQHSTRHRPWRYQPRLDASVWLKRIPVSNRSSDKPVDRNWLSDYVSTPVVNHSGNTRCRGWILRRGKGIKWCWCTGDSRGWHAFCSWSFGLDLWWWAWSGLLRCRARSRCSRYTWLRPIVRRTCRNRRSRVAAARCATGHTWRGTDGRAGADGT